ncbi:MAG TPA: AAA family ATPase [Polyangiales bacterium]|nr:AAA family ATPase [Polyangiales bacterium]
MSQRDENMSPGVDQANSAETGPRRVADRFVLHKLLGTGASGSVYSAYDEQRSEIVALKFLTALDPGSIFRFKSEFRLLTNLRHPNLLQLYDLSSDGTDWLLSMELIDGTNFLDFVRPVDANATRNVESREPPPYVDEDPPTELPPSDSLTPPSYEDPSTQPGAAPRSDPAPEAVQLVAAPTNARSLRPTTVRPVYVSVPQPVLNRTSRPLVIERLRDVLLQLTDGLHALHRHARLHRDLKPANLLVAKSDGRLVICDFGLALLGKSGQTPRRRDSLPANDTVFDTKREIAGTPMFMSPEQVAGGTLTVASDWYSVGVILYVALTGHIPMPVTRTKVGAAVERLPIPDPRELEPGVPEELAALALRLMDPDPKRRSGYSDVLAALSGSDERVVKHDSFIYSAFLGRENELAALQRAFDTTKEAMPTAVLLSGSSGMGKSALAQHFLTEIESEADALVLRGRCYEHEQLPYKTLDPLIDELTTHLLSLTRSELNALLPDDIELLASVFPTLRRVVAIAERPSSAVVDPRERRRLAFQALRVLCTKLARKRRFVVFVDDLQWGDSDSAAAFQQLLRPPDAPALLLLCSYRQEAEHRSELLRALRTAPQQGWALTLVEVKVDPLSPAAAERLATSLLNDIPDAPRFAPQIAREAEGNPFFIAQLARHVATHGASSDAKLRLDSLIEAKLAELTPELRELLALIALSGRPIAHNTLREASPNNVVKGLRELEARAFTLSRRHDGDNVAECFHDRIRENAVRLLRPDDLLRLHLALAQALERRTSHDFTALLEHWKGAGERERACAYAIKAAEGATAALAFTRAAELYRQALELGAHNPSREVELRECLGRALIMAGRGVEAAAVFLALLPVADARQAIEFRMLATTQLLRGGKLAEGFAELERSNHVFGVRFPRSAFHAIASLLWRRAKIRIHERRLVVRDAEQPLEAQRARLEVLWEVAAALANADFLRGSVYAAELMLQVLPTGDPSLVAAAVGFQAIEAAASDRPARAQHFIDVAEHASRASSRDFMIGRVKGMIAICRQLQGRWLESVRLARESQDMQQRASRLNWDHAIMIWWELASASQAGQIALLKQRVPEALRDAEARGDVYAATSFRTHRSCWAWLAMDRPDLAEYEVERAARDWNPRGYQFQHWHMAYARAETDLYRRTPSASVDRLDSEWRKARLIREVNGVRIDMLYTRARLMLAMALRDKRSGQLTRAKADARLLMKERAPWSVGLGLLVLAGVAAFDDDVHARDLLEQAESKLRSADMLLHAEVARARRAQLERDNAALDHSIDVVRALGVDKPVSFFDLILPL